MRAAAPCLSIVLALSACGARSGLGGEEDDASIDAARTVDAALDAALDPTRDAAVDAARTPDAPADATFDAGRDAPNDACTEQHYALTPIRPEIMFVIDRSTSMGWGLRGPSTPGPSRWSILVDALRAQLPRYDARTDMGATIYPSVGGDRCSVVTDPQLAPAPMQAGTLLDLVASSMPEGRTPTALSLEAAERWFATHPDIAHVRAVVLATDGAPNCNTSLDARRCPCTGGAGLPMGCGGDAQLCLDDTRTLAVIDRLAAREVPTYVIGIDGDPDPALSTVLTRMALAGGRPNPSDPERAYYSVRNASDVEAAFDRIQASIVSCSLAVELTMPPSRPLAVLIDGAPIPQDPTRTEGWEWSDERAQTILLYGEACARAQRDTPTLSLEVLCGP